MDYPTLLRDLQTGHPKRMLLVHIYTRTMNHFKSICRTHACSGCLLHVHEVLLLLEKSAHLAQILRFFLSGRQSAAKNFKDKNK